VFGDFVAYRVKSDLESFLSKSCVECGEPLSSTVEKKETPQKKGSYITLNFAIKSLNAVHSTSASFNHGHRLFHEG
jgi:hypothetical protein